MKRFFIFLVCGLMMSALSVSEIQAQPCPTSPIKVDNFNDLKNELVLAKASGCPVDIHLTPLTPPVGTNTVDVTSPIEIPVNVILWIDAGAELAANGVKDYIDNQGIIIVNGSLSYSGNAFKHAGNVVVVPPGS